MNVDFSSSPIKSAWEVLCLFLIPIGGGIPGGVLLAKSRNLAWPVMMVLYFISDVILACIFEPVMRLILAAGKRSLFFARMSEALKKSLNRTLSSYGPGLGPLALILISFGVDPMTGRAASAAAGHGFVSGWALAITGDLFFFALIMACTLWLHDLLGDGTAATVVILIVMTALPYGLRRFREGFKRKPGAPSPE